MFAIGSAFPTLISASGPEKILSPTFSPLGAMMYLFSPSAYTIKAMFAVLLGSYSIVATLPAISSLFLLKSMILYLALAPPPLCLTVILPLEFLPACFLRATVSDFSGLDAVISSKVETVIPLKPGEVGLYFLIPILCLPPITSSGRIRFLCYQQLALRLPSYKLLFCLRFFPFS